MRAIDVDPSSLTHEQVEKHFQSIPDSSFKQDWQHAQYIDAVKILLIETIPLPWAKNFPWDDCVSATKTLRPDHPTLAREVINGAPVELLFSTDLNSEHRSSLQSLSRSLRENSYAIRTEITYCPTH
ncbi:hypothetical protein AB833_00155 [Chromatiales bacterium (ex Bugula neritina AB1)]|nr:hypothetical protein AB833_00155 [Chromatiales bacterium (ex Bugula neritina AB1)]